MILNIYKNALDVLLSKPFKLWGLSLMNILLALLISVFGILPIVTVPAVLTLSAGMSSLYLCGYRGMPISSDNLFSGFKNFVHTAGGMCWRALWILIWMLIPVVGIVIAVIKSLSYAFVPYILTETPSISAVDALKFSMQRMKGLKAKLLLALVLPVAAFVIAAAILVVMSFIPFVGTFFRTIAVLVGIIFFAVAPMFLGLVAAGFYEVSEGN